MSSVTATLDDAGMVLSRTEYMPYGKTWFQDDASGEEGKHAAKYNSQVKDKETGFFFYNARHFDPQIARFVTADSVIDGEASTQGWNRYMYVKGNPVRYSDPTGHDMESIYQAFNYISSGEMKNDVKAGIQKVKRTALKAKKAIKDKVKSTLKKAKNSFNRLTSQKNKTTGVGLFESVGFLIGGNRTQQVVWDKKGNIGILESNGVGASPAVSA